MESYHHFSVKVGQDKKPRDVFVIWKPQKNPPIHRISKLNDIQRSFEIHCYHSSMDLCTMRAQIESIIKQENYEKKNN